MWPLACLVVAILVHGVPAAAHDLPTDVLVQVFVKPEGSRLTLVVRVPLVAMGDVDYPTRGPGGLMDLARIDRALRDAAAQWIVPGVLVRENGRTLGPPRIAAARVSLPSDRSFQSYEQAVAHVNGAPIEPSVDLYWDQAMLDVVLEYAIGSDRAAFSIHPSFARLGVRVLTVLRFLPPDGGVRAFAFRGDPGDIRLDPRWHQAALGFVRRGFVHILEGADHLLFLVCLVIPLRRLRSLVPVVTAFAVAHSITLMASAFSLAPSALWFPPLIETLIAASIVFMAVENVLAPRFGHRWVLAFAFGLVHGFGFSFALGESLQFAGAHLLTSLLSFNVGVELGQLLVLALVIPPLNLLIRNARSERVATIVLSAIVAHTAWHWMVDRAGDLRQFTFAWPRLDAEFGVFATGWLLVGVLSAAILWSLTALHRRFTAS
jgi:hypothetical protein